MGFLLSYLVGVALLYIAVRKNWFGLGFLYPSALVPVSVLGLFIFGWPVTLPLYLLVNFKLAFQEGRVKPLENYKRKRLVRKIKSRASKCLSRYSEEELSGITHNVRHIDVKYKCLSFGVSSRHLLILFYGDLPTTIFSIGPEDATIEQIDSLSCLKAVYLEVDRIMLEVEKGFLRWKQLKLARELELERKIKINLMGENDDR